MRSFFLFMLFITVSLAQDTNKVIIDSTSGKPMLTGYTTREAFNDSAFSWWYNSQYNLYEPDTALIDKFREKLADIDILIVMGTWCGDSRREVPHFLKILDYADYPPDKLEIISVDRGKEADGLDKEKLGIEYVPTFIFYKGGAETGRITEVPKETLETDMAEILK